jgi:hypothetical protein
VNRCVLALPSGTAARLGDEIYGSDGLTLNQRETIDHVFSRRFDVVGSPKLFLSLCSDYLPVCADVEIAALEKTVRWDSTMAYGKAVKKVTGSFHYSHFL